MLTKREKEGEFCYKFGSRCALNILITALYFPQEKNAIIPAPRIRENDDFLIVLTHCHQRKTRQNVDLTPHVREAIERIRGEIGIRAKDIQTSPPELPEHTRMPRKSFPRKPSPTTREQPKPHVHKGISMISFTDFQEYGKVFKYLQEHPDADVKEICKHTGVRHDRVAIFLSMIRSESKQV